MISATLDTARQCSKMSAVVTSAAAVPTRARARIVCERRRASPSSLGGGKNRTQIVVCSERRSNGIQLHERGATMRRRANPLRSFDPEEETIPGLVPLDRICDDFVCKSSPAVEGSLRQIATDICALREDKRSVTPFGMDVQYDDGERRFEGRDGFGDHTYIRDNVQDAKAAVTTMRMGELDDATIVWRLRGRNSGGDLDVEVTTNLRLNLITGRATEVTEVWDTSASDAGAAAVLASSRKASALPKNIADAAAKLGRSISDQFGSGDGDEMKDVQVDPNDPMKFFTENNTPQDDYLQIALFIAAIYLVVKLLEAAQTIS